MNQFPPSPWVYHFWVFSDFFENSRRYSQLKVHHRYRWHRWQMQIIFNHRSFNYLVCTPFGSRVNLYIHLCLQVHFKVSAAWYCSQYLPPVASINNTSETGGKSFSWCCCWCLWQICRRCRWYRWCTLTCKYIRIFEKIWNGPNGDTLGLGETNSWKKPEAKNLMTLSL